MRFRNREEAGAQLGEALAGRRTLDTTVLALPGGGVVVGYQVSSALAAPLEVLACQRVMLSGDTGIAIGAVAEGGASYIDVGRARAMEISPEQLRHALRSARLEVERQVARFRGGRPLPALRGRAVILVDDGIANGFRARVAVDALRDWNCRELVLAAPVAARSVAEALRLRVDAVVYLEGPSVLHTPAEWYEDFSPLTDSDVGAWLQRAQHHQPGSSDSSAVTCLH